MKNNLFKIFALFSFFIFPIHQSFSETTTDDIDITYDVDFAAIRVDEFDSSICGHIGLDMSIADADHDSYNPCKNTDDPYFGACSMSSSTAISYYKVIDFNDHDYGIFIDNTNDNYCTGKDWCTDDEEFEHNWAKRVDSVTLEFYPHTDCSSGYDAFTNKYGGVRMTVSDWPLLANGGMYSADLGAIDLPTEDTGASLSGFVTRSGKAVGEKDMSLDAFQSGSDETTSTGYTVSGFASIHTNEDGYYTTGPIYPGTYKMYISDGDHSIIVYRSIDEYGKRIDIDLDKGYWSCFGINTSCLDGQCCKLTDVKKISLKAYKTPYLVGANGMEKPIGVKETSSSSTKAGFYLIELGDDKVALMTHDGYFLQALYGGNNTVNAIATAVSSWETFILHDLGSNKIALETSKGYYVRALHGGNNVLDAKATSIGSWETFTVVDHGDENVEIDEK